MNSLLKFLRNLSFKNKILAYVGFVTFLSLVFACLSFMAYDIYSIRKLLIHDTVHDANIISSASASSLVFDDPKFATELLAGLHEEHRIVAACIYRDDGTIFSRYARESVDYKFPTEYPSAGYYFQGEYLDVIAPIVFEGSPVGMIFIRSHLQELNLRIKRYVLIAAMVMVLSLAVALCLSLAFHRFITQPILALAKTSNLISEKKDYSIRSIKYSDDELGVLTDAFNEMLKQIELKDSELHRHSDQLETLVDERTKALFKTNEQLLIEIKERKHKEEQIKDSLSEKEVLLSEIHHRVKNNFEIISNLIEMTSMRIENQEIQGLLGDARARIYSMALVHAQLYQNDRFDRIYMEKHIKELIDYLIYIYGNKEGKIGTTVESSEVYLSVGQAVPCALVLNELIANAFKHAFVKEGQGNVQVSMDNIDDDTILLRVRDDGDGIPEGVEHKEATGLGLKLVRHLVAGQLKGEMLVNNDDGTEVCVQFKRLK